MEIKDFIYKLKLDKEFEQEIEDVDALISKINAQHKSIKEKYQDDTKSEFKDENIVYKNLIIYLLLKNGVKLNRPTQVGGTKYVINIHSKKLVMHNRSMHIDMNEFINTLNTLNNESVKESVKEFSTYMSDILSSSNSYGNITHRNFNVAISSNPVTEIYANGDERNVKVLLTYSSRGNYNGARGMYRLEYKISDDPTKDCCRVATNGGQLDEYSNNTDFSINTNFFKLKDEIVIANISKAKDELKVKMTKYKNSLESYIKLLNEFSLV